MHREGSYSKAAGGVLSKVQMLNLVLGVGVFSLLPALGTTAQHVNFIFRRKRDFQNAEKGGVWSGGGVSPTPKPPKPSKPPNHQNCQWSGGQCYHAYFSRTIVCFQCGWEEPPEPSKPPKPPNATHPVDHTPPCWHLEILGNKNAHEFFFCANFLNTPRVRDIPAKFPDIPDSFLSSKPKEDKLSRASLIHGLCAFLPRIHGLCAFFQAALDTPIDSPFSATLSVHGLHFTVCAPSIGVQKHFWNEKSKIRNGVSRLEQYEKPQFSEQLPERFPEMMGTRMKSFHLPFHSRSVFFQESGWSPRARAKTLSREVPRNSGNSGLILKSIGMATKGRS